MGERLTGLRRVAYSLGSPGFQLTESVIVVIALYYYLPPPGRGLVPQVSEGIFLGVLTVFGVAMLAGRFIDALVDPLVGFASDRSRSRWGRRRSFLIFGILPMVGIPALIFWPPGPPESVVNGYALALLLSLYFIAFTVYVAPYLALLPELASDAADRTRLATLMALVGFPVLGLYGAAWPAGLSLGRELGFSAETALRGVVVLSLVLAFLLCLMPILSVDERRFTRVRPAQLPFWDAIRQTLANRPFRLYLLAQLFFVYSVNVVRPSPIYYATVVLGRTEAFAAALGLALFGSTLAGLVLVPWLRRRLGAKRTMIACNLLFAVALSALWWLEPDVPGGPNDRLNLVIGWVVFAAIGIAIAGFLVLPFVLIGQVIDYDSQRTGANRAAIYFGIQGLLTKGMFGLASASVAYLFSRFGNSADEPLGVLLIGPLAGGACALSALIFTLYPEAEVLEATASRSPDESGPSDSRSP